MKQESNIHHLLDRLALLEQRSADLYAHYAALFQTDTDAVSLFSKMKREEDNHKAQVLLQKRLLKGAAGPDGVVSVDISGVESLIRAIESQLTRQNTDLLSALDFAIMLETNGMECTCRTLLSRQNAALAKLSTALTAGDQHHVKGLLAFRSSVERREKGDSKRRENGIYR